MAYIEALETITVVASGTIAIYTAVSVGGTDASPTCVNTSGPTDPLVLGVAQNAAVAGEPVCVAICGITKMVAGATIATRGLRVSCTSAGKAQVAVSTNVPIGISMGVGASDKLMSVLLGKPNVVLA